MYVVDPHNKQFSVMLPGCPTIGDNSDTIFLKLMFNPPD